MIDLTYDNGYTKDIQRGIAMKIKSKVFSLGNSNAIRIPKKVMQSLSLNSDDDITLEVSDSELIIKKALPSSIKELFAGYNGKYVVEEIIDEAVGEELI